MHVAISPSQRQEILLHHHINQGNKFEGGEGVKARHTPLNVPRMHKHTDGLFVVVVSTDFGGYEGSVERCGAEFLQPFPHIRHTSCPFCVLLLK